MKKLTKKEKELIKHHLQNQQKALKVLEDNFDSKEDLYDILENNFKASDFRELRQSWLYKNLIEIHTYMKFEEYLKIKKTYIKVINKEIFKIK